MSELQARTKRKRSQDIKQLVLRVGESISEFLDTLPAVTFDDSPSKQQELGAELEERRLFRMSLQRMLRAASQKRSSVIPTNIATRRSRSPLTSYNSCDAIRAGGEDDSDNTKRNGSSKNKIDNSDNNDSSNGSMGSTTKEGGASKKTRATIDMLDDNDENRLDGKRVINEIKLRHKEQEEDCNNEESETEFDEAAQDRLIQARHRRVFAKTRVKAMRTARMNGNRPDVSPYLRIAVTNCRKTRLAAATQNLRPATASSITTNAISTRTRAKRIKMR